MNIIQAPELAEFARLLAVERFQALGPHIHDSFRHAAAILQQVAQTPVAGFSLMGRDRQWFRSALGPDMIETDRNLTFCTYAIELDTPFIVRNASLDPIFENHPLLQCEPKIEAYFGISIRDADNQRLGALCVCDFHPRPMDQAISDVAMRLKAMLESLLATQAATGAKAVKVAPDAAA
ncbi:GAF domain-containing protein [Alcaligenaceae bacterium A4P071]|nr:GAF domain-containing protein [Alcaligenaceae bacterium C4P045]MDQ2184247.1 GAF domain-containing protein [Alcaligenaceae bacterium A4P071]